MYKFISFVKKINNKKWEGILIKNEKGVKYITNGIYKWVATEERISQLEKTNKVDIEKIMESWNRYTLEQVIF